MREARHPTCLVFGLIAAMLAACGPFAGPPAGSAGPARGAAAALPPGAPPSPSAAAARAPLSPPIVVRYGDLPGTSNAGMYVALERGYFREQGLDLTLEPFGSLEQMIPPLTTNQIDAAGGGVNASMFSAIGRGLPLKIVAGISGNGAYSSSALVVRRELIDSGRVKDFPDLKGLRIAVLSKSTGLGAEYFHLLEKGGFTEADIDLKLLPFADVAVAMSNGALDAGLQTEPFVAQLVHSGVGVRWRGAEEIYPGHQITVILYGSDFAERQEPAIRFLTAYLRGAREYHALIDSSDRTPLYEILAAHTPIKDLSIYPAMVPSNIEPDGTLNVESLRADQDLWVREGYIEQPADFSQAIDLRYRQVALERRDSAR